MNFVVDVSDRALDSLPQSLSFAAFEKLLVLLDRKLGDDPLTFGQPADHPEFGRVGMVYRDGFQTEELTYLFSAYFHFKEDENTISVWDFKFTIE
ncbi:MAG: hypothetical protein WD894_19780 [Pirellulales bacterium]